MIGQFTDHARKVMGLANEEACHLGHEYLHPEHILLGIILHGANVGSEILKWFDLDLAAVQAEVVQMVGTNPPPTARAKKLIELAMEEARNLGHNYLGTEHLLLGILDDGQGIAAKVLATHGLTAERARRQIIELLGPAEPTSDYVPCVPEQVRRQLDEILGLAEPAGPDVPGVPDQEQQTTSERCRSAISGAIMCLENAHSVAVVRGKSDLANLLRFQIEGLRWTQKSIDF